MPKGIIEILSINLLLFSLSPNPHTGLAKNKAMQSGNDYAELCDLGPSRWSSSSRNYHQPQSSLHHSVITHPSKLRSRSTSEDIIEPYGNSSRITNSTSSLRGSGSGVGVCVSGSNDRSGLYYSPPGTSYTIIERPNSPHYYYNTAGGSSMQSKTASLPNRGVYLGSSSAHIASSIGSGIGGSGISASSANVSSSRHNINKKRPISPEQVLRLFGTTTSSSSAPSNYNYSNGGVRDRDRRSPASSPPSTTHQVNKVSETSLIFFFSTACLIQPIFLCIAFRHIDN